MLDAILGRALEMPLAKAGDAIARRGIDATTVTLLGGAAGALAAAAIALGWYGFGLLCFVVNRLADGLDGPVARAGAMTDFGSFLDILIDSVVYAALAAAFALANPQHLAVALLVMISLAGSGTAMLAFAAVASKRDLRKDDVAARHLLRIGSLVEGTETIAFFTIVCLWPQMFNLVGAVYAVMCWITVGQRVIAARAAFGD